MKVDKQTLKENLTIEQVKEYLEYLCGEPRLQDANTLVCRTICHNGHSHKLYYYNNSHLFCCYTNCDGTWDIYELTKKVKTLETGQEWTLYQAILYVANFFGFCLSGSTNDQSTKLKDWDVLEHYKQINSIEVKPQNFQLEIFDESVLTHLPTPRFENWENEGIKNEVIKSHKICFDPINRGIVIPHYDINNNLIGIRERTLIKEDEKKWKYIPAFLKGKRYNHPLSLSLYNLNWSKNNIKTIKKAIVFESEKSCLKYESYFGQDADITVAICGSNLISYQVQMLLNLGIQELIIGLDRQYQQIGDEEYYKWVEKLKNIAKKYRKYVKISFLFDTTDLLNYKDSPIDQGAEVFLELFNNRLDADGKQYK